MILAGNSAERLARIRIPVRDVVDPGTLLEHRVDEPELAQGLDCFRLQPISATGACLAVAIINDLDGNSCAGELGPARVSNLA